MPHKTDFFNRLHLKSCKFRTLKTRMHSSRMHTACSSSHRGGGLTPLTRDWIITNACLHACWDTPPWVWAWRPPGCGPGDAPLGVGLETPTPGQTPQLPPWVWAWRPPRPDPSTSPWVCPHCRPAARHAGIPPAMHAGIPPPLWTE